MPKKKDPTLADAMTGTSAAWGRVATRANEASRAARAVVRICKTLSTDIASKRRTEFTKDEREQILQAVRLGEIARDAAREALQVTRCAVR